MKRSVSPSSDVEHSPLFGPSTSPEARDHVARRSGHAFSGDLAERRFRGPHVTWGEVDVVGNYVEHQLINYCDFPTG